MEGGAESGFRHVEPAKYRPRLLHFCGDKKNVVVMEVKIVDGSIRNKLDLFRMVRNFSGLLGSIRNDSDLLGMIPIYLRLFESIRYDSDRPTVRIIKIHAKRL